MTDKERLEILFGGSSLAVTRWDLTAEPPVQETVTVKVRKLTMNDLMQIATVMQEPESEAALYLGKPSSFVSTMEPECVIAVIEEGRRLNLKSFEKAADLQAQQFAIQKKRLESLGLDVSQKIDQALQSVMTSSKPSSGS